MAEACRDWVGEVVAGEFHLRQYLGGSEHSGVFLTERAKQPGQKAAIKFIAADPASADLQISQWKHASELSHPDLLRLFETGRCRLGNMDLLYVVMEYAQEDLSQILPQRPLAPEETADVLAPALDALRYIHAQGFVHGHLKPSNILAVDNQLKLSTDTLFRAGEPSSSLETPGAYDAPEATTSAASPAGDIWSLGATLVEALTQSPISVTPDADPQIPAALPQPFLDIARNCLRRDPQLRWTLGDIAARLNPVPAAANTAAMPIPEFPATAASAPPPTESPSLDPASPARVATAPSSASPSLPASASGAAKPGLQNQSVAKQQLRIHTIRGKNSSPSGNGRYIIPAVAAALVFAALLSIPRLLNRRTTPQHAYQIASQSPAIPPAAPSKPASQPEPKRPAKSSQPPAHAASQTAQQSASRPAQPRAQDSLETASDKNAVKPPAKSDRPAAPGIARGEVMNQVLPDVSDRARATIRGTVRLAIKAHVDASGTVTAADLDAPGPSKYFADSALQAARKWDFTPAKLDGRAVPSEWLLRFEFTPSGTKVFPKQTAP